MNYFFILGYPRSRTAWIANFLTTGNSFCFHDGLSKVKSVEELKSLMQDTGKQTVGNSDCGNTLFLSRIKELFPEAKFVLVHRSAIEIQQSAFNAGLPNSHQIVPIFRSFIQEAYDDPQVIVVNYQDLNHKGTVKKIWDHCLEEPFCEQRWELLKDMQVQIHPHRMEHKLSCAEENINTILKTFNSKSGAL